MIFNACVWNWKFVYVCNWGLPVSYPNLFLYAFLYHCINVQMNVSIGECIAMFMNMYIQPESFSLLHWIIVNHIMMSRWDFCYNSVILLFSLTWNFYIHFYVFCFSFTIFLVIGFLDILFSDECHLNEKQNLKSGFMFM